MASHGIPRIAGASDKSPEAREKELARIEKYKALVEQINLKFNAQEYDEQAWKLTTDVLKTNPEYYTIWNRRRQLLLHELDAISKDSSLDDGKKHDQILDLITSDLSFLIPRLQEFPKCYWIWKYRLWLLDTAVTNLSTRQNVLIWQGELKLVGKMLTLDSRNFHGWNYRRLMIGGLEQLDQGKSMSQSEFAYTTDKIKQNLSNFSAWHYRSKLLPQMLGEQNATALERRKVLDDDLEMLNQALWTDPFDQSLWFYHQYLVHVIIAPEGDKDGFLIEITNHDRLQLLEQELDSMKEMVELTDDSKWLYLGLLQTAVASLEIDAGSKIVTTLEMRHWLEAVKRLDPLRKNRWADMEKALNI